MKQIDKLALFLLVTFAGIFIWSGIKPTDRLTWIMEVAPAVVAAIILIATYKNFPLTQLSYCLIWFFCNNTSDRRSLDLCKGSAVRLAGRGIQLAEE